MVTSRLSNAVVLVVISVLISKTGRGVEEWLEKSDGPSKPPSVYSSRASGPFIRVVLHSRSKLQPQRILACVLTTSGFSLRYPIFSQVSQEIKEQRPPRRVAESVKDQRLSAAVLQQDYCCKKFTQHCMRCHK